MRLAPADTESFRNRSRAALPPLRESYIARIADELPWAKPADSNPDDQRPPRAPRIEAMLGRAVVGLMVLLFVSALV